MDDDDDLILHLQCDVKIQIEGPTNATVNKWTADALRNVAAAIERDELDTGFHPVKDNVGKVVGEVYLSHEGEPI